MNKPYAVIFFGFLAVLMGIGKEQSELIPSELKLSIGISLIAYGVYLIYKPTSKKSENQIQTKKQPKKGRSYIYLTLGVLLLKSPDLFTPNHPYENEMNLIEILVFVFGFGFVIYGLNLFFKEKRKKRESGSIE
ncbi:hypothetical protein [Lacinutrix sp. Hel_I_90]|uniref:hypothetical protein n=1 Tax=Lacinutrix sp. Hel_I_90 TaxID=1249999 RepID=UPI0005C85F0F|nr:hypothetical protein [Lacinutrix sp. Hel_I_90]